jgi:hypothetical protein
MLEFILNKKNNSWVCILDKLALACFPILELAVFEGCVWARHKTSQNVIKSNPHQ